MLVSSLSRKKTETLEEGERESERDRGVGKLNSLGEGGRVLKGGVELERMRVVQRRILLVTKRNKTAE